MERIRKIVRARPLTVVGVLFGLLVLTAAGIAGGTTTRVTELEDEVAELEDERSALEGQLSTSRDLRVDLEAEVDEAKKHAESAEERAQEVAQEDIADERSALADQSAELDDREAELTEAQQTLESSTIPDGTWQLGRDYEAGTYRAPGGGGCYWEKLTSPSGKFGDLITNGGFEKNQTLVIDSPYFHTSDCGEWVKIG